LGLLKPQNGLRGYVDLPGASEGSFTVGDATLLVAYWSMSALAHFADSSRTSREVRQVPGADLSRCSKVRAKNCGLFDHFVGSYEYVGALEEGSWLDAESTDWPGLTGSVHLSREKVTNPSRFGIFTFRSV